jgi:hypothetical protein
MLYIFYKRSKYRKTALIAKSNMTTGIAEKQRTSVGKFFGHLSE